MNRKSTHGFSRINQVTVIVYPKFQVVQKCNIEFQIDQSHWAKLPSLLNAIGQCKFQD